MITILNPRVKRSGGSVHLASRPPDLNGRIIGLLDNGKRNFDVYLDCTEELLKERFTFATIRRRKPSPLRGIPRDLLDEMAEQCNTIITGSGD